MAIFRIRGFGYAHIPRSGPVLICANHQSHLDPVIVGMHFDRRLNYVARKSLFKFRPFAWLIDYLEAIPLDREGLGVAGIKETLRRLRRDEVVLLFPEGTRTFDGELGALAPGFCALARRTRSPLLPVGVDGAFAAWPRWRSFPLPADIIVVVGRPIGADEYQNLDDDQLVAILTERLAGCFEEARERRRAQMSIAGHTVRHDWHN
jgi:1-acyl-sn-glycerol-3-phosphate acyltransferase